jgi:hypothetical protein
VLLLLEFLGRQANIGISEAEAAKKWIHPLTKIG